MSEIHDAMESWGERRSDGATTLRARFGVEPASPEATALAEVLEILSDGEAHTTGSVDGYLQSEGIEMSGCQIAALIGRLELDGHRFQMFGPYDIFGAPERFKLISEGKS